MGVKVMFTKSMYKELEKSFGKKDLSKLHQKVITDKNGHQRKVWVKGDENKPVNNGKGQQAGEENKNQKSYAHTVGDHVIFNHGGRDLTGKIAAVDANGVRVIGTGSAKGQLFNVRHENVKQVTKMVNPADAIRGLMDANSVKSGWRGTDGMQPKSCDSVEGLLKTVESVRGEFSSITDGICRKFGALNPIVMKRQTLKSVDRIKEKLREDEKAIKEGCLKIGTKYEPQGYDAKSDTYHCRTIRDCDGHTICLNSVEDVANVLRHLDGMKEVARIKNNFGKPSKVGYSDINANIKLSNGVIVELQVNTTANMVAKERYGHALYEVYRSIESNPKYAKLADLMANAQTELYGLSNRYSREGNFPTDNIPKGKDGNPNIFSDEYKHEPFAAAIRNNVKNAIPLYQRAKAEGALNDATIKHFEHLIEYIK